MNNIHNIITFQQFSTGRSKKINSKFCLAVSHRRHILMSLSTRTWESLRLLLWERTFHEKDTVQKIMLATNATIVTITHHLNFRLTLMECQCVGMKDVFTVGVSFTLVLYKYSPPDKMRLTDFLAFCNHLLKQQHWICYNLDQASQNFGTDSTNCLLFGSKSEFDWFYYNLSRISHSDSICSSEIWNCPYYGKYFRTRSRFLVQTAIRICDLYLSNSVLLRISIQQLIDK